MSGDGVTLTPTEVDGLAMRLTIDHLRDGGMSLPGWEDVPELAEATWLAVADALTDYAAHLYRDLRTWEQLHGVDTRELLERAS